jgi:flagellar basal body-associated protein FliL
MEDFEKQENIELEANNDDAEAVNDAVESAPSEEAVESAVADNAPETAVEEAAENTAEADENEITDSETTEPEAVEADAFGAEENEFQPFEPEVKKSKIQKPIIIAAIIVIVAIIAAGAYFLLFNNSVVGTWVYDESSSSADEASSTAKKSEENVRYYTFDNDGKATISLGTIEISGTWEYSNDSASADQSQGNKINITILPIISGSFDYKVEGNAITGKKLILTTNNTPITFNSAQKTKPELKVSKKFKAVKGVTGTWKNKDFNYIYTFNSDGTCDLKTGEQIDTTGTYTVDTKKKEITIVYVAEKKSEMKLPYTTSKDNKKLTLSGYEFTKVNK